jgi:hypothetical protein
VEVLLEYGCAVGIGYDQYARENLGGGHCRSGARGEMVCVRGCLEWDVRSTDSAVNVPEGFQFDQFFVVREVFFGNLGGSYILILMS